MAKNKISDLRSRVTIRRWTSAKIEGGGINTVLLYSYDMWAKVENRTGRLSHNQSQDQWSYDYKITLRLEESRPIRSDYTIDYQNKRLKINELQIVDEGKVKYYIARCSTLEELSLDDSFTNYEMQVINYTGIGGESDIIIEALINKTVKLAFKDGIEFKVITSGTPTGKQVKTTKASGALSWSISFEPGEQATIVYDNV